MKVVIRCGEFTIEFLFNSYMDIYNEGFGFRTVYLRRNGAGVLIC